MESLAAREKARELLRYRSGNVSGGGEEAGCTESGTDVCNSREITRERVTPPHGHVDVPRVATHPLHTHPHHAQALHRGPVVAPPC